MYAKILLAYDGSVQARRALNQAKAICGTFGSKLEIVHVYTFPGYFFGEALFPVPLKDENAYYECAEQVVKEASAQTADLPNVQVTMLQGNPAKAILAFADECNCDLIIIGSRGHSGIKEFVLGSVSHNVVQHTKVPILVVK